VNEPEVKKASKVKHEAFTVTLHGISLLQTADRLIRMAEK